MAWAIPQYEKQVVDRAGAMLVIPPWEHEGFLDDDGIALGKYLDTLDVINNWRSSHSFPLNTFQSTLRKKARKVDTACIIAQRIKRLSSIGAKLRRFPTMKLSQMQDIGGCRAIVQSVHAVDRLVALYKKSGLKHELYDVDDYIRVPQRSGYRGVHLKYRYHSDRKQTYRGLRIEMQIRSPLQHAWATAVETVGTFVHQALKSSLGEKEWLRFFALMGSAIADREGTAAVPNTPPNKRELIKELKDVTERLNVEKRLQAYGEALETALPSASAQNAHYFLLQLDTKASQLTVTSFNFTEVVKAHDSYWETERALADNPDADAVLVSVESLASLRRAYPNYFADTNAFIEALRHALAS